MLRMRFDAQVRGDSENTDKNKKLSTPWAKEG
ncbi:MAG: hypothetical protein K0S54_593 [Alphaproteobacteria bacterium]|jgi:hypothetical protein|nr:hypothetical protein [Alphaproteobacteria bacterium]